MRHIGAYAVERELKAGGMGRTLVAHDPRGRTVVLKVPLVDNPALFARLRQEARVGKAVRHPHLAETLDAFEHEGRPVLVVAWVDGVSLQDLMRGGPLDVAAVAHVGKQVASVLHALHSACDGDGRPLQVVHRDIAPGNILVDLDGDAFVIDLGIARWDDARQTRAEAKMEGQAPGVVGTMRFVAPERLRGDADSARSDVWSLCCVLAELARGRPLFGGNAAEIMAQLARYPGPDVLPLDALAEPLRAVLRRGLALKPAERPDASTLSEMLAAVRTPHPDDACRARVAQRVRDVRSGGVEPLDPALLAAVTDPLALTEPDRG